MYLFYLQFFLMSSAAASVPTRRIGMIRDINCRVKNTRNDKERQNDRIQRNGLNPALTNALATLFRLMYSATDGLCL